MKKEFNLSDFLAFDKMISPTFLIVLYYFHMGGTILISFWFIFKGLDTNYGGGVMVMGGLANLLIAPFLVRLFYELIIVLFKIHSRLVSIDAKTKGDGMLTTPAFVLSAASQLQSVVTMQPNVQTPPVATVTTAPTVTPMQDFWSADGGEPIFSKPDSPNFSFPNSGNAPTGSAEPVGAVNFNDLTHKIPNWPLVLASLFVLIGVMGSYADVMGMTYSIKNSTLGMFALLAAVGMLGISAAGLKWLWFVSCYAVVLLGSVVAMFDDKSLFSQASRVRSGMESLGGIFPGANQLTEQVTRNAPSPSSFLTITFYLLVIALIFCGYWALTGRYQEKGLATR